MYLEKIASIRTGLVTARKKAKDQANVYTYKMLNLKCINESGYIDEAYIEEYSTGYPLKYEYLTHMGDILIRLSAPYTALLINSEKNCNLVIPSHLAIIRVNEQIVLPEYVLWILKKDDVKQKILKNNSGSSAFGTIRSGFFGNLQIPSIPIQKQEAIGRLLMLSQKEQYLLHLLAEEKRKYTKLILNQVYDVAKRGR